MLRFGFGQSVFIEIDPKWLIEQAREQGLEIRTSEAHEFARKICASLIDNWLPEEIKYFANEQYYKEKVDAGQ